MKLALILTCLILIAAIDPTVARRSGGGGRSSSGSRGSSGGFGSIFGGSSKKSSNSQSSYPKQTWSSSGTGTGGSHTGGGSSYPKQTWSGTGTGNKQGSHVASGAGFYNQNSRGTNAHGSNIGGGGFSNPSSGIAHSGNKHGSNIGAGGFANPNSGSMNTGNKHGSNIGGGGFVSPNHGGANYGNKHHGSYGGGSIGGGRFTNPNRGGWSNPNVGRSHGYYGAGGQSIFGRTSSNYNYRSSPFGGYSGTRGLALGAGAGFIGGAVAGMAAVSMYHQYRQYQSLMYCYSSPMFCGGGYGYGYGYNRRILINAQDCLGGCPNQAYCDYGICRCRDGYEAKYGQCWKSIDTFNSRQSDWNTRTNKNYNPYHGCSQHKDCQDVDMNMICSSDKCACRKDMKWNDEVYECQIFVDVDCTGIVSNKTDDGPAAASLTDNSPVASALTDLSSNHSMSAEYEYDNDTSSIEELDDTHNSTLESESVFDKVVNITSITANDTLIDSELTKINPNKTSEKEIKAAFCREVSRTIKRYAPPPERYNQQVPSNGSNAGGIGTGVLVIIIIAVIAVIGCVIFGMVKMCSKGGRPRKENYDLSDVDEPPRLSQPTNNMQFVAMQDPPPYTINDQGGYPELPVPYPPGPDNPNPTFQPPPGSQITYPPAPGGPTPYAPYPSSDSQLPYQPAPYPQAPGMAPYPQAPGMAPYPQAPGMAPYQPYAPGAPYPTQ